MTDTTHEQTINTALGEVLSELRRSWLTRSERTGSVLVERGRPDILIEEASGWPVVIEAEKYDYTSAENDAKDRLNLTVATTGRSIETAIALVYPDLLEDLDGSALRKAIRDTTDFEYALYTHVEGGPPSRLPSDGWITGGVRDLAMLVHRAAVPPPRIDALAAELENGVRVAANEFTRRHADGSELGKRIADVLGQGDDAEGQTRRMAMTVIANALVFHESLAEVEFNVPVDATDANRGVLPVDTFRPGGFFAQGEITLEWERILQKNYWPIFWSAKEILRLMPTATAHGVLDRLWQTGQKLVSGGVTQSHDLTGLVFQRLIADRKFLATNYTQPAAAALLAALALPANRPLGGADWGDAETLAGAQIGDFACGTGTLLSSAYQRMSFLHELHGGNPRELHGPMMHHGLVGLDVINIAVHLTASMLAGSHPDTPFDGECLLTMPYGGQSGGDVAVGSLELLAEHVQRTLLDTAVAVSAGGRAPSEIRDLVSRMEHNRFDLVIMNPPFTRSTNHEGRHANVPIPSFAAFDSTPEEQAAMSDRVTALIQGAPSHGNAGEASEFVELAHRKIRNDGSLALVLPLSSISGSSWEAIRARWRECYEDFVVVTIAGAGSHESSFSAYTGMAECMFSARRTLSSQSNTRGLFVILHQKVQSAVTGELLATELARLRQSGAIQLLENEGNITQLRLGNESFGVVIDAPLPRSGPWPLGGIEDGELAKAAHHLQDGKLLQVGLPDMLPITLPVTRLCNVAQRGPIDRDINEQTKANKPRGPFKLIKPPDSSVPTYPMLWAHASKRERQFMVEHDSEGHIKPPSGGVSQATIQEKAARIWRTATRLHYNRDLQFNSQSLIAALTERPCIGGRAWPSVIFAAEEHEYAFALWSNSTLGLMVHWWLANKSQSGRGSITVTSIPNIPTLDVRTLTQQQIDDVKSIFDDMRSRRFLPFDQIDEDPVRAELDRRLLVDVLGMPPSLCEPGGTIDLLRRKLAKEPQIRGTKKSRVVFRESVAQNGETVITEGSAKRSDR